MNERVNIDVQDTGEIRIMVPNRQAQAHNTLMKLQSPTGTDVVQLNKDIINHQRFRENYITDADIWSCIYPDNCYFQYSTLIGVEEEGMKLTHDTFQKANTSIYLNDAQTCLRLGGFTATKNMTSIFGGVSQLTHNYNRRLKYSIGGMFGSLHSVNTYAQYNLRNSTSVKCKINRVYQDPDDPHHEVSLTVREQLSEEFSMEMTFMRGLHDELRISALNTMNVLEDSSKQTIIEVETKIKKHITTGTLRVRNHISEYLGTNLELNVGSAGHYPTLGISSDICINMFIFQRLFKNMRSNRMQVQNSRMKNINFLFGFGYGSDGFSINIGVELAGITLKLPILFPRELGTTEDGEEVTLDDFYFGGFVIAYFAGFTYQFKKLVAQRKKLKQKRRRQA
ncbi:unnamed protein product [Moneuplotes crassus]|uniref:Uncharacterized protein n=1 Tax=Euplotes crassus TaxID=5936 RepID=A0AAD1UR80_EUPCR|nr:unnamed protein product [Moneuplotes crassus]